LRRGGGIGKRGTEDVAVRGGGPDRKDHSSPSSSGEKKACFSVRFAKKGKKDKTRAKRGRLSLFVSREGETGLMAIERGGEGVSVVAEEGKRHNSFPWENLKGEKRRRRPKVGQKKPSIARERRRVCPKELYKKKGATKYFPKLKRSISQLQKEPKNKNKTRGEP